MALRPLLAGISAAAMVFASAGLGLASASAAELGALTILSPANGETVTTSQPLIEGDGLTPGQSGIRVEQSTDGGETWAALCETSEPGDGPQWQCDPAEDDTTRITEGVVGVRAVQVDAVGTASAPSDVVWVRYDAPAPALASPAPGASVESGTVAFEGTGADGHTIEVRGTDGAVLCSATVAAGAFSCEAELGVGSYRVTAHDTTSAAAAAPIVFRVHDTAPGAPTIDAPAPVLDTDVPSFSGTGEIGATVTVQIDGAGVCNVPVDATGAWACQGAAPLAAGTHTIAVTQRDLLEQDSPPAAATLEVTTGHEPPVEPGEEPPGEEPIDDGMWSDGGIDDPGVDEFGVDEFGIDGSWGDGGAIDGSGASGPGGVSAPGAAPVAGALTHVPWTFRADAETPLAPGRTVTITAAGLPVGASVLFELHSTPRTLGTVVVGTDGSFRTEFVIPADAELGQHSIFGVLTPIAGTPTPASVPVTLVDAASVPLDTSKRAPVEGAATGALPAEPWIGDAQDDAPDIQGFAIDPLTAVASLAVVSLIVVGLVALIVWLVVRRRDQSPRSTN